MWWMVMLEAWLAAKAQCTCDTCDFDPLALATNMLLARRGEQLRVKAGVATQMPTSNITQRTTPQLIDTSAENLFAVPIACPLKIKLPSSSRPGRAAANL